MAEITGIAKQFAATNGIQLAYVDHASQHPLLLLPGITGDTQQFSGLIQAGLNRRRRVIIVDLRGRGLSGKPERGYSVAEHAADVIGFLDALGLEQVAPISSTMSSGRMASSTAA